MMNEYTPEYAPEITIFWLPISPGEPYSFNSPPVAPEIEIQKIEINGKEISDYAQMDLLSRHEGEWVQEILKKERMVA